MTDGTTPIQPARRRARPSAALLAIVVTSALIVGPVVARAASASRSDAPSICRKVSAGAVAAIVGYSVPAATGETTEVKATKANDGISAVQTTCTFGPQASIADLKKDVTLDLEVTSRPITTREVQQQLAKTASASLKIKLRPYSGLGVPGIYFSEVGGGISGEGISGFVGTKIFGADVFEALSESKLASLAKLAADL